MEGEWLFYRGAHFNGHMYICIFIVFYCFLYTVYLTFKSPHLPLGLHQCFTPHCKIFAYRGADDFMPAKIGQVCQSREGE